jgi:hypothetical protein
VSGRLFLERPVPARSRREGLPALATRLEVGDQSLELLTCHMKSELLTVAMTGFPAVAEGERTITTRPETAQNGWQGGVVVGRVDRGAAA